MPHCRGRDDAIRITISRPTSIKTSTTYATWSRSTTGFPTILFVRAVREDPQKKGLLYAGTERGVLSLSPMEAHGAAGNHLPLRRSPTCLKNDDLVVATTDDVLDPLMMSRRWRQFTDSVASGRHASYHPLRRIACTRDAPPRLSLPQAIPQRRGHLYYAKKAAEAEVKIEILDAAGSVVPRIQQ